MINTKKIYIGLAGIMILSPLAAVNVSANAPANSESVLQENTGLLKKSNDFTISSPGSILNKALINIGKTDTPDGLKYDSIFLLASAPLKFVNFTVVQDGSPVLKSEKNTFVGESNLVNNSDIPQVLKTNGFSKVKTSTVTSQVTHGLGVGADAKATFGIPFIGSTQIGIKASYEYTNSKTDTTSETLTYSVDPQSISVPAHTRANISVKLKEKQIFGKTKLLAELGPVQGTVQGNYRYKDESQQLNRVPFKYNWNDVLAIQDASKKSIGDYFYDPYLDTHNLMGAGVYTADYGTDFDVVVEMYPTDVKKASGKASKIKEVTKYTWKPTVTKNN